MEATIHRIRLSWVNAWLYGVPGNWLLVDSGTKLMTPHLFGALESFGCHPGDISLMVLTHAHYDHAGAAARLKKLYGMPIAVHAAEAPSLSEARLVIPDGFMMAGRVKAYIARHLLNKALMAFDPVAPDILLEEETRAEPWGFRAAVVPTPGHTGGSIGMLTDDGVFFSGDLAIHAPHRRGIWRYLSPYGESQEQVLMTWRTLLDRGVKRICPGHGPAFAAEELAQYC